MFLGKDKLYRGDTLVAIQTRELSPSLVCIYTKLSWIKEVVEKASIVNVHLNSLINKLLSDKGARVSFKGSVGHCDMMIMQIFKDSHKLVLGVAYHP